MGDEIIRRGERVKRAEDGPDAAVDRRTVAAMENVLRGGVLAALAAAGARGALSLSRGSGPERDAPDGVERKLTVPLFVREAPGDEEEEKRRSEGGASSLKAAAGATTVAGAPAPWAKGPPSLAGAPLPAPGPRAPRKAPPRSLAGILIRGGGGTTPVGDAVPKAPGPPGLEKAADDSGGFHDAAAWLADRVGLLRKGAPSSTSLEYLNPPDAGSMWTMPWAWGAVPVAIAGGGYLGWRGMKALEKRLGGDEVEERLERAKARYHRALAAAPLGGPPPARAEKAAAAAPSALDDLYDQERRKEARFGSLGDMYLGALVGGSTIAGLAGLSHGAKKGDDERKERAWWRALRRRRISRGDTVPVLLRVAPRRGEGGERRTESGRRD